MKKRWSIALAVLLCLVVITGAQAESIAMLPACYRYLTAGQAAVDASQTAVYQQPALNAAVVGHAAAEQPVNILVVDANKQWAFVQCDAVPAGGWMPSGALVMAQVLDHNAVVVAGRRGYRVNLRSEPSQRSVSLGKYYTGTLVEILDASPVMDGDTPYVLVRVGDATGYMDQTYLSAGLTNSWTELKEYRVNGRNGTQHALFSLPDQSSAVRGYATNASYVTLLGVRDDGWYHVMYQGAIGYINSTVVSTQTNQSYTDVVTGSTVRLPATENSLHVVSSQPGNRVNLRTKPSKDAPSLGKYYTGTPVYPLGGEENGYTHVRIGYVEGYMDSRFLTDAPYGRESELIQSWVAAADDSAVMYKWAVSDSTSEVITTLRNGTPVIIIGVDDRWCHVVYEEKTHGYIHRESLYPEP